ncbi:hypothetical protein ACVIWV_010428 [Bradyrhizobium diazoefficiens]|jgi:hypothetical protein|uniref:Uncharacterized protein n=1 Tax=Bradyrhizobium barranii subsp. barranii TaxID=2823807 RepID=A0A9X9YF44_9BRAD|nr:MULTISPECIES: hypothetical protein [Bradyrhizobium]BAP82072.1 uncharacterized protein NK6_a_170 [Bradyrhizobium diazoefficiens]MBP2435224.1 hypothetical protein [Bradyrhizobium elkanii]MCP1737614.1 hypothetical protein [Bradyrhizobium elkanii]MCP1748998.1 hypothetical protein [Bradyrhizobium japonicum]MCP1784307.1 hypothetical protein [Bradyrhizobium japonicum]
MIHRIITSDGLSPGLSFQVARTDAIRDKLDGHAETWGKLTAKLAIARKDQDRADRQRRGRGRAGQSDGVSFNQNIDAVEIA